MNAVAEFGKSLMAFANLFTVLIFFQAAWQQADPNLALFGGMMWFLTQTIAFGIIAAADFNQRV